MAATRRRQGPRPKQGSRTLQIREIKVERDGRRYIQFRVEGWRDADGKRRLKQFASKAKAQEFVATESISMLNAEALHTITTRLTPEQVRQAETAFNRLGDRGTLDEAVTLYLGKAAPPETPKPLKEAMVAFLIGKEAEELRPQSIRQLQSTVSRFIAAVEARGVNHVHEVSSGDVKLFLRSLRAKNKVDAATTKTKRNYRLDLSSFFNWCGHEDRRWIRANPCEGIGKGVKIDETGDPEVLTIRQAARMMRDAETFADGAFVRYLALGLFAGIRPGGELAKLAAHPEQSKLIDIRKGIITIPSEISKTRKKRQIMVRPNLRAWLEATEGKPILPTNHNRLLKTFRKRHGLSHDELRHSFISYHVSAFRSVGDAAIEAGNSEKIINNHYLNLGTRAQGLAFWRIKPKRSKLSKKDAVIVVDFMKSA